MTNWVILFVRHGFENKLINILNENIVQKGFVPFLPIKEFPFRKNGIVNKNIKLLFPGYIFIKTDLEVHLIAKELKKLIYINIKNKNIYSILHYGKNKDDIILRKEERSFWENLLDSRYCVSSSLGYKDGDKIMIISGAMVGMEGQIKKIDRHKREAIVELELIGVVHRMKLMLEVIEKFI